MDRMRDVYSQEHLEDYREQLFGGYVRFKGLPGYEQYAQKTERLRKIWGVSIWDKDVRLPERAYIDLANWQTDRQEMEMRLVHHQGQKEAL